MTTERVSMYRSLGTTDEVNTCDLCGKKHLKDTVMLGELDADGNVLGVVYFGCVCAAKATGWTVKQIRNDAAAADRAALIERGTEIRDTTLAALPEVEPVIGPPKYGPADSGKVGIWLGDEHLGDRWPDYKNTEAAMQADGVLTWRDGRVSEALRAAGINPNEFARALSPAL